MNDCVKLANFNDSIGNYEDADSFDKLAQVINLPSTRSFENAVAIFNADQAFNTAIQMVKSLEGGYVVDSGGPTNHGITIPVWNEAAKKYGWPKINPKLPPEQIKQQMLKFVTQAKAVAIFKSKYWKSTGLHIMAGVFPLTAIALLDIAINGGIGKMQQFKSTALPIMLSGLYFNTRQLDLKTALAVNNKMQQFRAWLVKIKPVKYAKYKRGWNNRSRDLKRFLQSLTK